MDMAVGVAVDADGNVYVADAHAHAIFVLLPPHGAGGGSGGGGGRQGGVGGGGGGIWTLEVLAGDGVAGVADGAGNTARMIEPYSLALDPDARRYHSAPSFETFSFVPKQR